ADVPRFARELWIGRIAVVVIVAAGRNVHEAAPQAPAGIERDDCVAADESLRMASEAAEQPAVSAAGEMATEKEGVEVVDFQRRGAVDGSDCPVAEHRLLNGNVV